MVTLQGLALIMELIAGVLLIVGLIGFGVSRAKPWLFISAAAFIVLIMAVTMIVSSSG